MSNNLKCVVLNATYEPLSVLSARRALRLVLEGKASPHKYHAGEYIHSARETFAIPSAVVLKRYIKKRMSSAILTRKNLFERDNHTCQYCMRISSDFRKGEFLTRDHIVPASKGGSLSWVNLVTCCNTCNNKKGNMSVIEAGMTLHSVPFIPTIAEVWARRFNLEY